jgi:hypothetical protein
MHSKVGPATISRLNRDCNSSQTNFLFKLQICNIETNEVVRSFAGGLCVPCDRPKKGNSR